MVDDDLQCVMVGAMWSQNKALAKVARVQGGIVHLKQIKGTLESGHIVQHKPTANPKAILAQAKDYWCDFWQTRKDAGPQDDTLRYAVNLLPQLPQIQTEITMPELQWALGSLQSKKARGMDGFSNLELKQMPEDLRPSLLALLNKFTKDKRWPTELCHARMALLYKTDEVGDISMTRPITILASVYRLWAKLATKKMLAHIQAHLPKTLYGSVPGRCKMDMIGVVQTKIEKALPQGQDLCGISLDFSKAYNTLPRDILAKINQRLGMGEFWSPYHNFLGKLQRRHFTSAGSWGEAIYSSVGVPEGCPIAVVQMILITWLCTVYVRSESQAEIHSYVDDWVALLQQSDQALKAVQAIQCISGKLGMILSLKKSTIFATKAKLTNTIQGRLAQHGLALGTIRNPTGLGINFQTMGQPSPEMRDKRWESAKILLERLQYMPWATHRKTQILTRGIFPLIFYGCHTWRTGKEFLREVRAKCNHTVWGKKQYHLHYLAPLFSGQEYEPATYVARQRFAALLRLYLSHPDMVKQVWDQSIHAKAFYKGKTRGTISLFQHQLNDLGWAMQPGGDCETAQGWRFNIWSITTSQFLERVTESWEYSIQQHLRTKMHLEDMETFSASFSQYPTQADPMLEGFMRKVRLGGMFP